MVVRIMVAGLLLASLASCSVVMAGSREAPRELGILQPGTERDLIVAELGTPVLAIDRVAPPYSADPPADPSAGPPAGPPGAQNAPAAPEARERYDLFTFAQGRSSVSNTGRAVLYGAAAVMTLGLSEVVTVPVELAVRDRGDITLRTHYGADWRLTRAEVRDGEEWVGVPEFRARVEAREQAARQESAKLRQ